MHCVVWLVLLDPQRSIDYAAAPSRQEGPGRYKANPREPPWSRTFQLAPGGRLGSQPVPGQRGTEKGVGAVNAFIQVYFPYQANVGWIGLDEKLSFIIHIENLVGKKGYI